MGSHCREPSRPPFPTHKPSLFLINHDQCLPLPRDLSACRLQFILHCPRSVFLKGGGEVSDHANTSGAQGHEVPKVINHLKAFQKSTPASFLKSSSHYTALYLPPQILHPNHIRNLWHSPNPVCPLVPPIPLHKNIPLHKMPSVSHILYRDFARSLPLQTELTSPTVFPSISPRQYYYNIVRGITEFLRRLKCITRRMPSMQQSSPV